VLAGLTLSSSSVDVSAVSQSVVVTLHVTDDLSGYASGGLSFRSPSGNQVSSFSDLTRTSGTATDGIYTATVTFAAHAEAGAWRIDQVILHDKASNSAFVSGTQVGQLGFTNTLTVTG
jgi:hypothetical protein